MAAAATEASTDAIHLAMLVSAGLLLAGAAVNAVGIRNERLQGIDDADAETRQPIEPPAPPEDPASMTREWDAATYDRIAHPMTRWGSAVIDRLPLEGDERVLDAGCGSGRVTEQVLARLPHGTRDRARCLGADGRPGTAASGRRGGSGGVRRRRPRAAAPDRGHGRRGASRPPRSTGCSTTMRCSATSRPSCGPGARLVAQCGGGDNVARVRRVLAELGETWSPWNFAWPDETRQRLADAGFEEIEVWLHDEPTTIPPEDLHDYLRTVILGQPRCGSEPDEREPFVRAVAERLSDGHLDYVRLNIMARRA